MTRSLSNMDLGNNLSEEPAIAWDMLRPNSVLPLIHGPSVGAEHAVPDAKQEAEIENALVQIRLGLAGCLFMALRAHHPPTARHSLRVAWSISSWTSATDLKQGQRDELEVAALLHDVGKIGVPENILRQPSSLTPDQVAMVERARKHGIDILSACCASKNIIDCISYLGAWYDGSKAGYDLSGDSIPVGARMLAIVNAFDAMTTDQVYRKAIPIERAVAELFEFAGTQFDPVLVNHYTTIQTADRTKLNESTVSRWLNDLKAVDTTQFWRRETQPQTFNDQLPFHEVHFDTSPAGTAYVDSDMTIARWSASLERITGLQADTVEGSTWNVGIVDLRGAHGQRVKPEQCPVRNCIATGTVFVKPMRIKGVLDAPTHVEMQCVPVRGPDGSCLGTTVVFRDMSSENTLEERVQSLHVQATRDPLTNVSNRAEFDRVHDEAVQRFSGTNSTFSLIICDIDRFKQVNDNHGHQAGDEALVSFSSLLRRMCRKGDFVARYGGEEFVMVCLNCTCSEASHVAEKIRVELSQTPLAELGGQSVTASFGVTELQPGDSAESMLRRADRGLLMAKESGRNMVVQLGTGGADEEPERKSGWFANWWHQPKADKMLDQCLATNVPINVAIQKISGFISDHEAEIIAVKENELHFRVQMNANTRRRRRGDRVLPLDVAMQFFSLTNEAETQQRTVAKVSVRSTRQRDRRQNPVEDARSILRSLRSYLMAQELPPPESGLTPVELSKWVQD